MARSALLKPVAHEILKRKAAVPLPLFPTLFVDMGPEEQNEVKTTLRAEFQTLGPLLARFERRFGIQLRPEPRVVGADLVNPFAGSLVLAGDAKGRDDVRRDRAKGREWRGDEETLAGLSILLESLRGHVAPRDDVPDASGLNAIGATFLALTTSGRLISSVGPNSLMGVGTDNITKLWSIPPHYWAALHDDPSAVTHARDTQYTARYHSPQILAFTFISTLNWLCNHPDDINRVGTEEGRRELQERILQEQFFSELERRLQHNARLILQNDLEGTLPTIQDITDRKAEAVPPLPPDIVTHRDEFNIAGFVVDRKFLDSLETNEEVYVTVETRRYKPGHTPEGVASVKLKRQNVTLKATKQESVFSGRLGELVLAPCIHNGNADPTRAKVNLFVQMRSAGDPAFGFHPSGGAARLYEKEGHFVAVGNKIPAAVPARLIDPLLEEVRKAVPSTEKEHPLSANWLIERLIERNLVRFTDSSWLETVLEAGEEATGLIKSLTQEGRTAVQAQNAKTAAKARKLLGRLNRLVPGLGLGQAA